MNSLRRNLLIAVVICAVADAGLIGWLVSPEAPSKSATEQQLADTRTEFVGLRAEATQLRLLNQRVHDSQEQIQELMAEGIPEESDAGSKLLAEFSRIATASQVQVSGAEYNPDKKAQLGLRRYQISLQVAGSYGGVVHFLNLMERSPMFFIIRQVSVSGGRAAGVGGPATDQVKLEVQLDSYVRTNS